MITAPENTETVDLIECRTCGAEQHGHDKFCRRCGASQRRVIASAAGVTSDPGWIAGETRPLPGTKHYDSVSGALVNLVTEGVSTRASSLFVNRWTMLLASTLVAIPLWLMIVMLSPLDAYVAARTIARRV
jgi:ribosomal protein L40E